MDIQQNRVIEENVLENMSDGVLAIDLSGTIITFNAPAALMLGLNREDVLGKKFVEVFFEQEGSDEFNQVLLDAMYESNLIHNRMIDYSSGYRTLALFITTTFLHGTADGKRERMGIVAVFRDITEVKQLRDAEQRLTEELKGKHRELQEAYIQVEERNSSLNAALRKVQVIRIAATAFSLILFVGIGLYSWNRKLSVSGAKSPAPDAAGVTYHTVTPQLLSSTLQMAGTLDPINVVNVVSPFAGKVKEVSFQYGQMVKAGQVLLVMDASEIESRLGEAKSAAIKATERLRELENWENSTEVARTRRSLSKARLSLDSQKRTLEETERLFKKGIVPATEVESTRQQFLGQQMDFQSAEEELKAVMDKASADNKSIARMEKKAALNRLAELESQIARAVVKAPVSGVIVLAASGQGSGREGRRIERGTNVQQGEIFFPIGDLTGFSVTAKVDEVDVIKVKTGQKVKVTGDAFRDTTLEGKVSTISSQASKTAGGTGGPPSFDLVIAVQSLTQEQKQQIFVGMTANLEIFLLEKPDAIMVPVSAIRNDGGKPYAIMKSGEHRDVETGLTNVDSIEILKGLKAGEEIAL